MRSRPITSCAGRNRTTDLAKDSFSVDHNPSQSDRPAHEAPPQVTPLTVWLSQPKVPATSLTLRPASPTALVAQRPAGR